MRKKILMQLLPLALCLLLPLTSCEQPGIGADSTQVSSSQAPLSSVKNPPVSQKPGTRSLVFDVSITDPQISAGL